LRSGSDAGRFANKLAIPQFLRLLMVSAQRRDERFYKDLID